MTAITEVSLMRIAEALERIALVVEARPSNPQHTWIIPQCAHEWRIDTAGATCSRCGLRQ